MVNVIMHGCNGHMGRVVTELIEKDENVQIVAGIDAYTGVQNEYPVFPSIKECTVKILQWHRQLTDYLNML